MQFVSDHGKKNTESVPSLRSRHLPLAIAKLYKLPIIYAEGVNLDTSSPLAYLTQKFSAKELKVNVEAKLPIGGGGIETVRNEGGEPRYVVYDNDGSVRHTLKIGSNGKVMEIVQPPERPEQAVRRKRRERHNERKVRHREREVRHMERGELIKRIKLMMRAKPPKDELVRGLVVANN